MKIRVCYSPFKILQLISSHHPAFSGPCRPLHSHFIMLPIFPPHHPSHTDTYLVPDTFSSLNFTKVFPALGVCTSCSFLLTHSFPLTPDYYPSLRFQLRNHTVWAASLGPPKEAGSPGCCSHSTLSPQSSCHHSDLKGLGDVCLILCRLRAPGR